MAANSILSSGNTSFLNELYNGNGSLSLESLSIGDITGVAPVLLLNPDAGVLQIGGAVYPSDIQDNSGSIGTPGQVLVKANAGTDMLWSSDIDIPGSLTTGTTITVAGGSIELQGVGGNTLITNLGAGSVQIGGTLTTTGNITVASGVIELQGVGGNTLISNLGAGSVGIGGNLTTSGNITIQGNTIEITGGGGNTLITNLGAGNLQVGGNLTTTGTIRPSGLVDANGVTGTAGQYLVANGTGGFVWTTA